MPGCSTEYCLPWRSLAPCALGEAMVRYGSKQETIWCSSFFSRLLTQPHSPKQSWLRGWHGLVVTPAYLVVTLVVLAVLLPGGTTVCHRWLQDSRESEGSAARVERRSLRADPGQLGVRVVMTSLRSGFDSQGICAKLLVLTDDVFDRSRQSPL